MTTKSPINPVYGAGQNIAATTTATTVTLGAPTQQIMLTNTGPGIAYVRITPVFAPATAADAIIAPNGSPQVFTKFRDILQISVISASTSAVNVIPVEGSNSF